MKKILLTAIILITLLIILTSAFAQGMMGNWTSSPSSVTSDDHTAREEAEGKEIWEKLQAKQLECKDHYNDHLEMAHISLFCQKIDNPYLKWAKQKVLHINLSQES